MGSIVGVLYLVWKRGYFGKKAAIEEFESHEFAELSVDDFEADWDESQILEGNWNTDEFP